MTVENTIKRMRDLRLELNALEASLYRNLGIPDEHESQHADIKLIQELCAKHYGVSVGSMRSRTKVTAFARPRMVAIALCHELTEHTLADIGSAFLRDHGTVSNAVRAVANRAATEPKFASDYALLLASAKQRLSTPKAA